MSCPTYGWPFFICWGKSPTYIVLFILSLRYKRMFNFTRNMLQNQRDKKPDNVKNMQLVGAIK